MCCVSEDRFLTSHQDGCCLNSNGQNYFGKNIHTWAEAVTEHQKSPNFVSQK